MLAFQAFPRIWWSPGGYTYTTNVNGANFADFFSGFLAAARARELADLTLADIFGGEQPSSRRQRLTMSVNVSFDEAQFLARQRIAPSTGEEQYRPSRCQLVLYDGMKLRYKKMWRVRRQRTARQPCGYHQRCSSPGLREMVLTCA